MSTAFLVFLGFLGGVLFTAILFGVGVMWGLQSVRDGDRKRPS